MVSHSLAQSRPLRTALTLLVLPLLVMWVVLAVDVLVFRPLGASLSQFGLAPHEVRGLRGILFGPFLHGDVNHLVSNSVPWLVLGGLIVMRSTRLFLCVVTGGMVLGGLGTWLIGAPGTVHIGASGLIFCFFGFLVLRGWFERSLLSIVLATGVAFIYGGVLWGVLPSQPGISWEAHLCGLLAGIALARLLPRRI